LKAILYEKEAHHHRFERSKGFRCQAIKTWEESCPNNAKDACCSLFDKEKPSEKYAKLEPESRSRGSIGDTIFVGGLFVIILGVLIGLALPYSFDASRWMYNPDTHEYEIFHQTETVYGHPIGWGIGGMGFVMLLFGYMMHFFHGKVCGDCCFFGSESCSRQERMFEAVPCGSFMPIERTR
jgi:hypothetical protein